MDYYRLTVKKSCELIDAVSVITSSRKKAKKLIDEGLVSVSGTRELRYRRILKPSSTVEFCLNPLLSKPERIHILYDKDGVLVLNKPPFINSNRNKPNLEEIFKRIYGRKIHVVHRLDKHTSGTILAVENQHLFEKFKEIFRTRKIRKEYYAITPSNPKWSKKVIKTPLDGKETITEVSTVKQFKKGTLLLVQIPTGRKHQIRRHLAMIGLPVSGEFIYWKKPVSFPFNFSPRILLHSYRLEFENPLTRKQIRIEAPLPLDFSSFLNSLQNFTFNIKELSF